MLGKLTTKLLLLARVAWIALCAGSTRLFYDRISNIYDMVFLDHLIHSENIVNLLTSNYQKKKHTILDLGCGTGMLSKALAKQGFHMIGIDISLESLRVLQRTDRRVTLVQADIESLPFLDCHFGALVCLGVWRHLSHIEVVLDEICRVLSKDGSFILGYFPPKLGGLVNVSDNHWGKMLLWLYNKTVCRLGFDDMVGFELEEKASQAIRKRFAQVHRIDSGQHWHLILACHPHSRLNSI